MFDSQLNARYTAMLYAHGPEWGFAIPADDFDALREVVRICSRVWNGAGALILVCDSQGKLRPGCDRYLETRPLDEVWLHPRLAGASREALSADPRITAIDWELLERSFWGAHPAELVPRPAHPDLAVSMTVPIFASESLQRIANVTWGIIEDAQSWCDFDLGSMQDASAFLPLLDGQLGLSMTSPLRLAQTSMDVFEQRDLQPWPYLWVFDDGGFDELVAFWNFRSGASAENDLASVVGLPREALGAQPQVADALGVWARATRQTLTPSVLVRASAALLAAVEAAFASGGVDRLPGGEEPRRMDAPSTDAHPAWLPCEPRDNGRITRGAWEHVDVTVINGRSHLTLPRPRRYLPRGGARLVVCGLRTPLPITRTAAERMLPSAMAHARGLAINIATGSPWSLPLAVPDRQTALEDWASDYGYQVSESPPGLDARALLQRLGSLRRLDGVIDETHLELLVQLAPLAREGLARRIAKEVAKEVPLSPLKAEELADHLRDKLRDEGLLLELEGRTTEQLESALSQFKRPDLQFKRQDVVRALAALVNAGFVQRGRNVRCPRCHFDAFLTLRELDERIRCRACGQDYLLPVDRGGGEEALVAYRLDGLMARVMERHILPVILAIRALRNSIEFLGPDQIWPGMLFTRNDEEAVDIDLLAFDGLTVVAGECKLDARRLEAGQVNKLLQFAEQLSARPMIAALVGDFDQELVTAVEKQNGLVLTRADLLETRPR